MKKILSKSELKEIEDKIDAIARRAEILCSFNSFESKILREDNLALDYYLAILEKSYHQARIAESGLKLIIS